MDSLTGRKVGSLLIKERLGAGGMAEVYKALHTRLNVLRAVKVIRPEFSQSDDFRLRFSREAQAVARLRHPNIVQIHDFGEADGLFYMVMEFIDGQNLKEVQQSEPLSIQQILSVVSQIASGLADAHDHGLLHRDLKLENIMLDGRGTAILTDFGIARMVDTETRLTQTGMAIGTPSYMAPEQITGEFEVSTRSDVYSLGIVLFELLTGRTPFDANTPVAVMMKVVQDPLPLPRDLQPSIPEDLENLILKATAKTPSDRHRDGAQFLEELRAIQPSLWSEATSNSSRSEPANEASAPDNSVSARGESFNANQSPTFAPVKPDSIEGREPDNDQASTVAAFPLSKFWPALLVFPAFSGSWYALAFTDRQGFAVMGFLTYYAAATLWTLGVLLASGTSATSRHSRTALAGAVLLPAFILTVLAIASSDAVASPILTTMITIGITLAFLPMVSLLLRPLDTLGRRLWAGVNAVSLGALATLFVLAFAMAPPVLEALFPSPDHRHVAFMIDQRESPFNPRGVVVAETETGSTLFSDEAASGPVQWLSDQELVYRRNDEFWLSEMNASPMRLAQSVSSFEVAPRTRRIALFSRNADSREQDLLILDTATSKTKMLFERASSYPSQLFWSPNEEFLAFRASLPFEDDKVRVIDANSGEVVTEVPGLESERIIRWLTERKLLLEASAIDETGQGARQLFRVEFSRSAGPSLDPITPVKGELIGQNADSLIYREEYGKVYKQVSLPHGEVTQLSIEDHLDLSELHFSGPTDVLARARHFTSTHTPWWGFLIHGPQLHRGAIEPTGEDGAKQILLEPIAISP